MTHTLTYERHYRLSYGTRRTIRGGVALVISHTFTPVTQIDLSHVHSNLTMFTMDKNLKIHSYIYRYLFFHFVLYKIFVHTYDIEEKSIQLDQA